MSSPRHVGSRLAARLRHPVRGARLTLQTRQWVWTVAVVVGLWLAVGVFQLVRARSELNAAVNAAEAARARLSPSDIVAGRAAADLEAARSHFASAHRRSSGPLTLSIRILPILGRQVRSVAALSGAAARVSDVGVVALADARSVLTHKAEGGLAKIATLRSLAAVATRTNEQLQTIDLGPRRGLVGPLAKKRDLLQAKLDELRSGASRGAASATAVADLLAGPRRYLLLAGNNAEMRAGSGMFLSIGELTTDNGTIKLSPMQPAGDLTLPGDGVKIDDADLAARWGWLHPNREWRNLGATPRFDATAPLAARMWAARTGHPVDGVLALDASAVSAVLAGTGPVDVEGRHVTTKNVEGLLLHDQYLAYPNENADQSARRESLGIIAGTALSAVDRGSYDLGRLATALAAAARGRHVLAWSSRPAEGAGWEAAGITGRLTDSSVMVSILNRAGNKLDHYLPIDVRLGLRPDGKNTQATLTIRLRNVTPPGEPAYIAGPHAGSDVPANGYRGIVAVDVPGRAGQIRFDGDLPLSSSGGDGPSRLIATEIRLDQGRTMVVVARFVLAGHHGALRIEPDARLPQTIWRYGRDAWLAAAASTVRW